MRIALTQQQRSALFAGNPVKLTYPGDQPCPIKPGHVEILSAHVRIEVTGVRRSKQGEHVLVYTLHNNRLGSRFLARHGDEYGYSHTGGSDVDYEAGEAVDDFTQKRITRAAESRARAELEQMIAAMEEVRSALDDRVRHNPDLKREIGRELWQIRGRIDAAKQRLKRRLAA